MPQESGVRTFRRVSIAKPLWVSDPLDDFAAYGERITPYFCLIRVILVRAHTNFWFNVKNRQLSASRRNHQRNTYILSILTTEINTSTSTLSIDINFVYLSR